MPKSFPRRRPVRAALIAGIMALGASAARPQSNAHFVYSYHGLGSDAVAAERAVNEAQRKGKPFDTLFLESPSAATAQEVKVAENRLNAKIRVARAKYQKLVNSGIDPEAAKDTALELLLPPTRCYEKMS